MIYAVDGVPFPKPPDMSSIQYTDSQIVTNAQRTVGPGAYMTKELLAEKLSITAKWSEMTLSQLRRLKAMRAGKNFFRLKYYDEGTGTIREGQFYSGDLTYTVKLVDRTTQIPILYQDISWPFVER